MNPDIHVRACCLIDAEQVEGISESERDWLKKHLAECAACRSQSHTSERALQVLRSNAITIGPSLVSTAQARVRLRARELRENRIRTRALWISCALSGVLGVASSPVAWRAFQWVVLHAALPNMIWETAFALWWLLPAGAAAVLLAWMQRRAANQDGHAALPR